MNTELTISCFGFTTNITKYKGEWTANLTHNILYSLSDQALKQYIQFLELVDFYLTELNTSEKVSVS